MFVLETPDASCFGQMERMFEMDTVAGRAKFRQFLEDSKPFLDDPSSMLQSASYPINRGFAGSSVTKTYPVGTELDRFGAETGGFLAEGNAPFWSRSLPDAVRNQPYKKYRVLQPFTAESGRAAPWFGKSGGALQVDLGEGRTIRDLLDAHIIEEIIQ